VRRAILLLAVTSSCALPAGASATDASLRPPPPNCDPAACPSPTRCVETLAIGADPATGLPTVTCRLR
jgi:hypothetical protein